MRSKKTKPDSGQYIFRRWIRDPKTGERRYPKNGKVFRIPVDTLK